MKVVIVGGVAGGASAAARIRRLDEQAEIIVLERGRHVSFSNCSLPYYLGGAVENSDWAGRLQVPAQHRGAHAERGHKDLPGQERSGGA